jgi:hypothetical protein
MTLNQWSNFRMRQMFELIILCVIALAVGYWATLWLMGRRNDVLHGHFVQTDAREPQAEPSPAGPVSRADTLQALLTSIEQDLKNAAQL